MGVFLLPANNTELVLTDSFRNLRFHMWQFPSVLSNFSDKVLRVDLDSLWSQLSFEASFEMFKSIVLALLGIEAAFGLRFLGL